MIKPDMEVDSDNKLLEGIRILILGQNKLKNGLLGYYLHHNGGATCLIGSFSEDNPTLEKKQISRCNIVLLDVAGLTIGKIRKDLSRLTVSKVPVALFDLDRQIKIENFAITKGVKGFFYLGDPSSLLVKGIAKIMEGQLWVPRNIMERVVLEKSNISIPKTTHSHLTGSEIYVLTTGMLPNDT